MSETTESSNHSSHQVAQCWPARPAFLTYDPRRYTPLRLRGLLNACYDHQLGFIREETGIEAGRRMAHDAVPLTGEVIGMLHMWLNTAEHGRRLYASLAIFDGKDVVDVLLPEEAPRTTVGRYYTVTADINYLCLCGVLGSTQRCPRDATLFIKRCP